MRIRELRAADGPRVLEFVKLYFPEEEALLGTRPEGFEKMIRRIFRWDARLLLGLFRLVGRPVYNFYVVEQDGKIVATTILSYPGPTGYISLVSVDAMYRRRGYARALLEHARLAAQKHGKSFLALDVLAHNAPAIALYERLGYRRLRTSAFETVDSTRAFQEAPEPPSPSIRVYRPGDAASLLTIVRERNPPEVERVLPTREGHLNGSDLVARTMHAEVASWVIDRGRGAEAWVSANVSPLTEAAHLAAPIVGASVEPPLGVSLVRTAATWCAARRSGRIMASVTEENSRGRAALEGGGFHEALAAFTLYRPIA